MKKNTNKLVGLMVIVVMVITGCTSQAASQVKYPESIDYEDYSARKKVWKDNVVDDDFSYNVKKFSYEFTSEVFNAVGAEEEPYEMNVVYSPLSTYYCLTMAYSGAKGETAKELGELLHMNNLDKGEFYDGNLALYNRLYTDSGLSILKIANSLWTDETYEIKENYVSSLAENMYASVHPVDFSDQASKEVIGDWISEVTNGFMDEDINVEFADEQVMALYTTIYYSDQWQNEFNEENNKEDVFYLENGQEVRCEYMCKKSLDVHWHGDDFSMVGLGTKGPGSLYLIQTDENVDLYQWLSDPQNLQNINLKQEESLIRKYGKVELNLPKFEFDSEVNIKEVLMSMGIEEPFMYTADFSEISDTEPLFIGGIIQKTKIGIDEKGIEAGAYDAIDYATSAEPTDDLVMNLNRPFIIVVQGMEQLLFVGVVNDPTMH